MNIRTWNNELAFASILFARVFSNISIKRANGKVIKVPCVLGNRSRVYKSLENRGDKKAQATLPMIVVTRKGITKNQTRMCNLHNEIKNGDGTRINENLYTPIPIDIAFEVAILAKYPADLDMIISNWLPFFNKDIFVSCTHPKYVNIRTHNQIIMDDSMTEENPEELTGTDDDVQTMICNFTFKTYIFSGTKKGYAKYTGNLDPADVIPDNEIDAANFDDTEIDSSEISSDFVKDIQTITFGFYAVPKSITFDEYFERIELDPSHPEHIVPESDNFKMRYDNDRMYWVVD